MDLFPPQPVTLNGRPGFGVISLCELGGLGGSNLGCPEETTEPTEITETREAEAEVGSHDSESWFVV